MITTEKVTITTKATIHAPVEKVWELYTGPTHIIHWNNASDDWHTPRAENDLREGGKFLFRMEAKDGSSGFDFTGEYSKIDQYKSIKYILADGRKVDISFASEGNDTIVTESFEAEETNSKEMQQAGWQSILDNFKKYVGSDKMKRLHFEISIQANAEKVYRSMIDENKYREWTFLFNPTSRFEGSWEKGSKILFLGTDQDGKTGGMVSRIKENIPNKFISIEHRGIIQNGEEKTSGAEVEGWAGALENYTFTRVNDKTILSVDTDSNEEFESYFKDTWPKALEKLKEICEGV